MTEVQEGDLVRFGSSGPVMSVTEIKGDKASCIWFDKDGHLQEFTFHLQSLIVVNNEKRGVSGEIGRAHV